MTKLSVNINKIATLRNSRGGNTPNVVEAALRAESFGAQGITVHPRPDERHIRYQDVRDLRGVVTTELNMEGNPIESFMRLAMEVIPEQATLVPDAESALTSNAGWDTKTHLSFLTDTISALKEQGIRTSIFLDPKPELVAYAAKTGADRIELYTESYATLYPTRPEEAIAPFIETAQEAARYNLGVNAGHDLSLENLRYFAERVPNLLEVSIGHALISEALYLGFENTIQLYLRALKF